LEKAALVFAGETRKLSYYLEKVEKGEAFLLQCGHCSENFSDCNGPKIHNLLRVILQMSIIFSYSLGKKIVNVGRIAGQYVKPRSSDFEIVGEEKIPVYKGDMINNFERTLKARQHDPVRILQGYFRGSTPKSAVNLILTKSNLNKTKNSNYACLWQKKRIP